MATVLFYRSTSWLARLLTALGMPPPVRAALGVRAFGLDLLVHAGPLRLTARGALPLMVLYEYLLPDLPLRAVSCALGRHEGRDPTSAAIAELTRLAATRALPAFHALSLDTVDAGALWVACAHDALTRVQ